jgi:hypothetical protein
MTELTDLFAYKNEVINQPESHLRKISLETIDKSMVNLKAKEK